MQVHEEIEISFVTKAMQSKNKLELLFVGRAADGIVACGSFHGCNTGLILHSSGSDGMERVVSLNSTIGHFK